MREAVAQAGAQAGTGRRAAKSTPAAAPKPSLGRLRPGEMPGIRGDTRPWLTIGLVVATSACGSPATAVGRTGRSRRARAAGRRLVAVFTAQFVYFTGSPSSSRSSAWGCSAGCSSAGGLVPAVLAIFLVGGSAGTALARVDDSRSPPAATAPRWGCCAPGRCPSWSRAGAARRRRATCSARRPSPLVLVVMPLAGRERLAGRRGRRAARRARRPGGVAGAFLRGSSAWAARLARPHADALEDRGARAADRRPSAGCWRCGSRLAASWATATSARRCAPLRGVGRLRQGRGDKAARLAAWTRGTCGSRSSRRRRTTRSAITSCGGSGPSCPAGAAWPCSTGRGTGGCWSSASRGSRRSTSGSGRTTRSSSSRSRWRWRA